MTEGDDNGGRRTEIFEAQNWRCCYCGVRMFAGMPLEDDFAFCRWLGVPYLNRKGRRNRVVNDRRATIEHLKRIVDGGSNDIENVVGACGWCNSNRQDYEAADWFVLVQSLIRNGAHPHGSAFPETSG